jgi:hypothetical protein
LSYLGKEIGDNYKSSSKDWRNLSNKGFFSLSLLYFSCGV